MSAQSPQPLQYSFHDTNWFEFRNRSAQAAYDKHRTQEVSLRLLVASMLFTTTVQLYFAVISNSTQHPELVFVSRLIRLLFLVPGWALCWKIRYPEANMYFSASTLANACILSLSTVLCVILIIRTVIGPCGDGESRFNCNNEYDHRALPCDAVFAVLFSIIIVPTVVKCYHWWMLALCWYVSLVSLVYCVAWANANKSLYAIPAFLFSGAVIYQYENATLRAYIALLNTEYSIRTRMHAENEKRVMEMRSVEMRHLLGNVAHDLKTPMQSFVMDLELVDKIMKRPVSQTAEYVTYAVGDVRKMVESIQNLTDTNSFMYMVINRAIDFAKSSSEHTLTPNLATINFVESIQWAVNMVKSKSSSVPVVFDHVPRSIHPYIITDKQWLIENILCLISNAAKFTTTGGVTVRCELQLAQPTTSVALQDDVSTASQASRVSACQVDELLIEVEDTGIGIPEDKRESMFRPFQQTMRMAGGTGLGLYSLRNRVEALKGTCGILGRRDGANGARIWFRIPYRPDLSSVEDDDEVETKDSNDTYADVEHGLELRHAGQMRCSDVLPDSLSGVSLCLPPLSDPSTSPRTPRTSILVVDDALTIRKSISRVLHNEGLSVDLAENGQMALEMMGLKRYDLVLMDLQMPVMDGLEAVRRLRQQESDFGGVYHQKVIGISAYTGEPYSSDALRAGMDGFIEKPFSAQRFIELCEEHRISLNKF